MAPRPPLDQRLRPGQRLALRILAGLCYGLVGWVLFAHKITPWPLGLTGTVLIALPVAVPRPLPGFVPALAAFWLAPFAPVLPFLAVAPLGYLLYEIAGRYRPRAALPLLAAALTGPAATAFTGHAGGVLPFAVVLVLAWTVGYARGEHRRYGDELVRHHAGLAEVERERARRGVAEERLRIARELHDVVAHSMSVITVQAGFGHLVVEDRPAEARAALAAIETTGRQALAELRHLLGVLRADGEPAGLDPAPGLGDLPELAARTRRAGVGVVLAVGGEPRELPAGLELTAYRIVQEALTNVVNHAARAAAGSPVTARVTVDHQPDALVIEVVDDGRATPPTAGAARGAGLGLRGMRERVRPYGGEVAAGPLPGGGFRVAARIPLPPPPSADLTSAARTGIADASSASSGPGDTGASGIATSDTGPGYASPRGAGAADTGRASAGSGGAGGAGAGCGAEAAAGAR